MRRTRRQTPFADRVEVWRPISGELLAAATFVSLDLAQPFIVEWYVAAELLTERRLVLVFDEFVLGRPDPLLLEAAHCVRLMRSAEHVGEFDHEEQRWYEEHPDDDEVWDPPTIPTRVLAAMSAGWEGERLADGALVTRMVQRAMQPTTEQWFPLVRLARTLERLIAGLADAVRIGDGAVVDARLPGELVDSWRWAA